MTPTATIPPRSVAERLRVAIRWCRDYHAPHHDPAGELGVEFVRRLHDVGLKVVWLDGSEVTEAQLRD
jgi:hypothetical protein